MGNADAPNPSLLDLLKKILLDFGNELLIPCDSIEELLQKLDKLENLLSIIYQDFREMFEVALQPSKDALIADEFTRHAEMDVRVSVASCISEIVRIYAPDGPYEKEQMKEFFQIAVSAFESLACMSGRAYSKAVSILGTMSYSKSCVLMLDLQCHDLVHQMFHLFLNGIRTSHSDAIFSNMENIMTAIIRSNYDCDESTLELAKILLARLKKENQNVSSVAFQLAENTFKNCSNELKTYLLEAIRCLGIPVEDYAEVVVSLFHDATQRENMNNLEKGQGSSTKEAPAKKSRGKAVISEDLTGNVLIKTLASESRPVSFKREAHSGEVSNPLHKSKSTTSKQEASKVRDASKCFGDELVGCRVKVWWPVDAMFYEGKITFFDHLNKKHQVDYDDGDSEILDLAEECWQLIGGNNLSLHKEQKTDTTPSATSET
ncbi:hypothetical protein DH2020_017787 [Rehmannia glutinosa]|uniref:Uncharacterized protein n=1 Tax=Rehmannia glutinosa TaxID=99300 RepID=A0ABR0WL59_REHGL